MTTTLALRFAVTPASPDRYLAGSTLKLGYARKAGTAEATNCSPCPRPIKEAALATFPRGTVWEFYGATEGQFTVCPPDDWLAHPGTVGRARPRRRLEVDTDGLVWCHVPPFARFEYWRDSERTADAWRGDAFTAGGPLCRRALPGQPHPRGAVTVPGQPPARHGERRQYPGMRRCLP